LVSPLLSSNLSVFQAAFNIDQAAFVQVLCTDVASRSQASMLTHSVDSLVSPSPDFQRLLTARAEMGYFLPGGGKAAFGVLAEAADQLNAIKSRHFILLFPEEWALRLALSRKTPNGPKS